MKKILFMFSLVIFTWRHIDAQEMQMITREIQKSKN